MCVPRAVGSMFNDNGFLLELASEERRTCHAERGERAENTSPSHGMQQRHTYRSQMHAMSLLLNTCSGMTNRVLIDEGARWTLQRDEQERESRTAGVKALYSMLVPQFVSSTSFYLWGVGRYSVLFFY